MTPPTTSAEGISQPITLATDYLLGAAALVGALLLARHGRGSGRTAIGLWAAGFLLLSAGAFLGGTWHGFSPRLPDEVAAALWKVTLAGAGAASFFLLAGAAFASIDRRKARWLAGIAALKLAGFLFWTTSHDGFEGVIVDSGLSMAGIVALQAAAWRRRRDPSAPWVVSGMLLSAGAAMIEALGVTPGELFSHDDLYHVIQTGSLYLLYRGGRLFRESRP
ncbi:MAG: hypothetical protein M3542_02235 [Acidobacteriota bacterium]|nr:hypothetical protein [Acidobacteriota bacterium]MDQ5873442.1 hypothetical protein [Acidobacteriota bacterium]